MTYYARTSELSRSNGMILSEPRRATNFVKSRTDDAHADSVAKGLGFRGGLVSALIHEEQFFPLALEGFGKEWIERGSYSFFYRTATCDEEVVQAFMLDPGPAREDAEVDAWSQTPDGSRVAEGSIGMGEKGRASALRRRMDRYPAGPSAVLKEAAPGMTLGRELRWFPLVCPPDNEDPRPYKRRDIPRGEDQMQRRESTTEPLEWFFGRSPWGPPVAGPLALARLIRPNFRWMDTAGARSIVGGMEVQFVNGPVFVDRYYVVEGRVVGTASSPRTDVGWFESTLIDPVSDVLVAKGLLMMRYFPAPSS